MSDDLAPLPRVRGHLSFIWIGIVLVVVGFAQIGLENQPVDDPGLALLAIREVDEAAPDFTVRLLDGSGTFTLSQALDEGRPVVLNFWASWCLPCREEMPVLDAAAADRPDLAFIGVAVDDTEEGARAFAEEVAVDYPLGFDASDVIGPRYEAFALPLTVVIAADGRIVGTKAGELDAESMAALLALLDDA
ncbi:MAG: TlpA family protein disulfide reductase [Acidimicrobiia bacterium]|nr:TlpA family protein disulfide reductase [Acidimicrobiia bacterium]